jgi:fibronectin type 3 domain-containing protein
MKGKNYTRITSTPVKGVSFTDPSALGGQTYYYVATAVDASGNESYYSEEIQVAVP